MDEPGHEDSIDIIYRLLGRVRSESCLDEYSIKAKLLELLAATIATLALEIATATQSCRLGMLHCQNALYVWFWTPSKKEAWSKETRVLCLPGVPAPASERAALAMFHLYTPLTSTARKSGKVSAIDLCTKTPAPKYCDRRSRKRHDVVVF